MVNERQNAEALRLARAAEAEAARERDALRSQLANERHKLAVLMEELKVGAR